MFLKFLVLLTVYVQAALLTSHTRFKRAPGSS